MHLAGLRRATGKSQRQLAELLCLLSGTQSVTRNEVSRWERGARVPEVWLPRIAQALGIPLREMEQAAIPSGRGDLARRVGDRRRGAVRWRHRPAGLGVIASRPGRLIAWSSGWWSWWPHG
ncbi:helix-turn-helix transcriptional regulator [Streptomyces sp. NPDC096012]|uniref:helix-turn-helix domain-containing protein n=1 Tax=Streptomyces sp. NPDC096012 TaxID=3155684 RepID=UPI00336A2509